MLLVQNVNLTWYKKDRGAAGAEARQAFSPAYPVNLTAISSDITLHNISFYQNGRECLDAVQTSRRSLEKSLPRLGFSLEQIQSEIEKRIRWIKRFEYQNFSSAESLNLADIAVCTQADRFEVSFFYDEHRSGRPFRRGHNKDFNNLDSRFYGKDCVNETAFVLAENQYGRIVWNERCTDYDTGEWYYQLHIYNLLHWVDGKLDKDIFIKNHPDFIYRQLAELY